jgi:curved DNA-binding protein
MKYKDYYRILGVDRGADEDAIKTAYRKLARKYHPDVSKEKDAEARFKDVAEAWATLKDAEKRKAYDQLGRYAEGEEIRPPPDWGQQFGAGRPGAGGAGAFEDIDLSDLFAAFGGGRPRGGRAAGNAPRPGGDYEAAVQISFDQAFKGAELELDFGVVEYDEEGTPHRVSHPVKIRIPRGVTDGQTLRVPGKGGKGVRGGRDGDLFLTISVRPHPVFRADGQDLYVDLPLAPWEAVLGTSVQLPTPAGAVMLKVPPGTRAGQQMRLTGRGVARDGGKAGNLYAIVQIVVPTTATDRERELYKQLAEFSTFNPRAQLEQEAARAH